MATMPPVVPGTSAETGPDPTVPVGSPFPGRALSHNEQVLVAGEPIHLGSSNVGSVWYHWQASRLFVRFLDGSLYCYEAVPLEVAAGMIETDSPGRYVWTVLRGNGYAHKLLEKGTIRNPRPQVIRGHGKR